MKNIIVTAGAEAADIDVFACAVAYAELLKLEGKNARAVIAGSFTMSVTPSILAWGAVFEKGNIVTDMDDFVLVDISDYSHFPNFVDLNKVIELYDHRHGFEDFRKEKLGSESHIEMVGACGTLIWDEFKKRNQDSDISIISAKLLLASIVSNTLNFKGPVTTDRDIKAFNELSEITGLDSEWISHYFNEQEKVLLEDFKTYLKTDTKKFKMPFGDFIIAQIELWDAATTLESKQYDIENVMQEYQEIPWILNIPNISKGFNYIYSSSEKAHEIIREKLGLVFVDNIAKTEKLMMRKEIMKILMIN